MSKPIAISEVREIQKPFSADAMMDAINERIKAAAAEGRDVAWVRVDDVRDRSLRATLTASTVLSKSLKEATERFKEAGYTVTHFPGDQRETESWSIRW
ncbi:hypothetical protein BAJUN_02140 [Bajunvirus bajun]|uniref:Uncharacterized protein n=1 Tax=Brevundimonas phage vB_BgoS-Bajun TaxID=2948594 RepID=A0A9E7N4Y9_9CAUD|nr:hypothetical protein BAJUN_02140 [Brevundimonas phage vB_BgoS-Bajun]